MSEVTATDDVHELVDAGEISEAIADRLDDNGFESVADLLIADQDDLEDVPYVGGERAAEILAAVDGVTGAPEPRDIDLEETESVVSEAAIPLAVRRGETVLAKSAGKGSKDIYHTRACHVVRSCDGLIEREPRYVEERDYEECQFCAGPETIVRNSKGSSQSDDPRPLVDSREVVLDATLGEKLQVTFAGSEGWTRPRVVVATEEATTWETPSGDTWKTRRVRISTSATRQSDAREYDLVVGADGVRIEDPVDGAHHPDVKDWEVESVGAVGRVSQSSYYQLVGQQTEQDPKPEGDDTWRKYQRGEA